MFKKFFNQIRKNSKMLSNTTLNIGIAFIIISAVFDIITFHK